MAQFYQRRVDGNIRLDSFEAVQEEPGFGGEKTIHGGTIIFKPLANKVQHRLQPSLRHGEFITVAFFFFTGLPGAFLIRSFDIGNSFPGRTDAGAHLTQKGSVDAID